MDKKNFCTSYIPLKEPYQIIKYGEDIGMQIGTLVASCMLEGEEEQPFRIESHSYPVVAYANKNSDVLDKTYFGLQPMEGVVWNRVELRDVVTICLVGDHLTWQEFNNFLWADLRRTGYTASPDFDIARELRVLGVKIDSPSKGKYKVHLELKQNKKTKERRVCSSNTDIIVINFSWDEDILKMQYRVMYQMVFFNLSHVGTTITSGKRPPFSFSFETEHEELTTLVNRLNTLKDEDWDLLSIFRSNIYDLPFEKRMKIINAVIDEASKIEE